MCIFYILYILDLLCICHFGKIWIHAKFTCVYVLHMYVYMCVCISMNVCLYVYECMNYLCVLYIYIYTYLLTYLLHGAEPLLKS